MTDRSFRVHAVGTAGTAAVAEVLAARLGPGDAVLLTGDLAAGKTTFVTAVVAALGSPDVVTSPTFALAQFYASPVAPVLHVDTYRLADVAEFRDLGLDEYLPDAVALVEWADLVAGEFVDPLRVDLDAEGDDRWITVTARGPRWDGVLDDLEARLVAA